MKPQTKEAIYIGGIVICSIVFFNLGQIADNRCASEIRARDNLLMDSEEKAAAAKLDFCISNRPSLNDKQQMIDKFELFRKMRCPERLLYSDCDQICRKKLILDITIDMSSWDNYEDEDDSYDLPLPNEGIYPEP